MEVLTMNILISIFILFVAAAFALISFLLGENKEEILEKIQFQEVR
jgi:hypothetical protein